MHVIIKAMNLIKNVFTTHLKYVKTFFLEFIVFCSKRVIFTPVAVLKNYKWCNVIEPNNIILRRLT